MNGASTATAALSESCCGSPDCAGSSGCAGSLPGASGGQECGKTSLTSESAETKASPATGGNYRQCGSVLCDGHRAHVPEAHWTFVPSCAHPECEKCLVAESAQECEYEHPCHYRLEVL
jgi:hypothetical protein